MQITFGTPKRNLHRTINAVGLFSSPLDRVALNSVQTQFSSRESFVGPPGDARDRTSHLMIIGVMNYAEHGFNSFVVLPPSHYFVRRFKHLNIKATSCDCQCLDKSSTQVNLFFVNYSCVLYDRRAQ